MYSSGYSSIIKRRLLQKISPRTPSVLQHSNHNGAFKSRFEPLNSLSNIQTIGRKFMSSRLTTVILLGALLSASPFLGNVAFAEESIMPSAHESQTRSSTTPLEHVPSMNWDLSVENIRRAKQEILELLGEDGITEDIGTRVSHSSTAWSASPHGDVDLPSFIVYPRNTDEVSKIARILHQRRIPSIGFSGGTSLEGTLAATHKEVCIDFSRMNKILSVNPRDMDVILQPAVAYEELNNHLASQGLFFPPDPGPGAQIGGMLSQGCSGTNAYRYGTVRDWVLGLTVVLADGTVIKTRLRPRKSSTGYNLTQLLVGSEGTLGWITEASCKITRKPENIRVAVVTFPSIREATESAMKIVQSGLQVAAMELLDDVCMRSVNEGGYVDKQYAEVATLFLKFAGSKMSVKEQIEATRRYAQQDKATSFELSANDEEADGLWQARKTALWGMIALKDDPNDEFISADAAVPISCLAEIIEKTKESLKVSGFIGSCLGHVGDGNFHTTILYNKNDEAKARAIIEQVQRMAVDMEGTVSGEHGIGLEFRDMIPYELGHTSVDAMRRIKLALDPLCLLNPDKMIRIVKP